MQPVMKALPTQTKKRPAARTPPVHTAALKPRGPSRPRGVQSLGTVRYEALRRALHELDAVAER